MERAQLKYDAPNISKHKIAYFKLKWEKQSKKGDQNDKHTLGRVF